MMRGLAMSGGGSRGQFHIGVLRRLLGELVAEGTEEPYDVYGGVSIGALWAAFLAQYPTGEEHDAVFDLISMAAVQNKHVWKRWKPFGKLHGIWNFGFQVKSSLLNSAPLDKRVRDNFSLERLRKSDKLLRVGAVSVDSGLYEVFDERYEFIVDAVLASAAYPAFFQPVQIPGRGLYTDGGVRRVTPIRSLIEAGCTEIDVSICHPRNAPIRFPREPTAVDMAVRALGLQGDELIWRDLDGAVSVNKMVMAGEASEEKRYIKFRVFHPDHELNEDPLHFELREAAVLQSEGYADAKRRTV